MEKDLPQLVLKKNKLNKILICRVISCWLIGTFMDASSFTLVCRRLELGCVS